MDLEKIKSKIITIQGQQVILDTEVANLYGVETKHVNQAVRNNPDKFPTGYILTLSDEEWDILRSKDLTAKYSKVRVVPKAMNEKALYMLATILKSPVATETTIAIIETFAKVRELSRTITKIGQQPDKQEQKNMLQRSGKIISDIISSEFETTDTETTIELNLAIVSMKHTIKRTSKKK